MASASDHIDHVRTQLPYALIGGIITTLLYIAIGFMAAA
jgi:Na+/H+ antiporter NhaC